MSFRGALTIFIITRPYILRWGPLDTVVQVPQYKKTNELIQIHGGIGMTDEFNAGLYLKRARVLESSYGNQAYHRNRYAQTKGI